MKRVAKDASVHEQTVKQAAELVTSPARRRRQVRGHVPDLTLVHTKMHDEVWATALALAGGDRHRIQVINDEDVIVHNHRDRRLHVAKNGTLHREMPERSSV